MQGQFISSLPRTVCLRLWLLTAEQTHRSINADGFGVAFYPSETDSTTPLGPCIFRSITPASANSVCVLKSAGTGQTDLLITQLVESEPSPLGRKSQVAFDVCTRSSREWLLVLSASFTLTRVLSQSTTGALSEENTHVRGNVHQILGAYES